MIIVATGPLPMSIFDSKTIPVAFDSKFVFLNRNRWYWIKFQNRRWTAKPKPRKTTTPTRCLSRSAASNWPLMLIGCPCAGVRFCFVKHFAQCDSIWYVSNTYFNSNLSFDPSSFIFSKLPKASCLYLARTSLRRSSSSWVFSSVTPKSASENNAANLPRVEEQLRFLKENHQNALKKQRRSSNLIGSLNISCQNLYLVQVF